MANDLDDLEGRKAARSRRRAASWSSLAAARRRRTQELVAWTRTLVWRVPLVAAAGLVAQVLAAQAGLPRAGLVGLAAAALVGWRLRFRPSEQARSWQRGAAGERRTVRLLERLTRGGYVVFHDLAVQGSSANVDHLVIGPTGVFVIDSKQWTGGVHQGADGLAWHNHHPLERTLETVRWEAQPVGQLLGTPTAAAVCVHGGHVRGGGLHAQGVAIVPAHLLRSTLGDERVLCDAEVELLATAAWTRLTRPPDCRKCGGKTLKGQRGHPGRVVGGPWSPTAMAVRQACPGRRAWGFSAWQDHDRRRPQQRPPGRPESPPVGPRAPRPRPSRIPSMTSPAKSTPIRKPRTGQLAGTT